MSVKQKPTIAILTRFVITPRAHTTARVNLGTWETDGTVKVTDYHMKQFWVDWDSILLNVSRFARAWAKLEVSPLWRYNVLLTKAGIYCKYIRLKRSKKKIEMCQWWWWEKMRRNEKIKLRISRKGKGWAKYCFFLKRAVVCLRQR